MENQRVTEASLRTSNSSPDVTKLREPKRHTDARDRVIDVDVDELYDNVACTD